MSNDEKIEVHLFTDGGCSGNPGPGGWAYILRHLPSGKEAEQSGAEKITTNNRMELEAVVQGLADPETSLCRVELFTDSVYVGKGISEWMVNWKRNGWKRKEKGKLVPVKNDDLWKKLDQLIGKHQVKYTRVAGHSGHPENDRVDELGFGKFPYRYLAFGNWACDSRYELRFAVGFFGLDGAKLLCPPNQL